MAEEKVGFGFEFGIKGDKEVKKGLEDIIRLISTAGNATSAVAGILGKAGGLLDIGAAAAPLALAATAMASFAYQADKAGENLRRTRFEIDRLSKMPVAALSDSDISANEGAILAQFQNLGLEAGNTFQLSFMDRLKNFGKGAYAVNWDIQASIANLFGAHMQSYEQGSPEAIDAKNRWSEDNKIANDRLISAEKYQQQMAAIRRKTATDTIELYSLNYGGKAGTTGGRVMPESFSGIQRQIEIQKASANWTIQATTTRSDVLEKQLRDLINAPVPIAPGSSKEDMLQDTAKRTADRMSLEAQITSEKDKQLEAVQKILELDLKQREIARGFMAAQNYGSWRAVGGGGHTTIDPRILQTFASKGSDAMPTDVGYDVKRNPQLAAILASGGVKSGGEDSPMTRLTNSTDSVIDAFKDLDDTIHGFIKGLVPSSVDGAYHSVFGSRSEKHYPTGSDAPEGLQGVPKRKPIPLSSNARMSDLSGLLAYSSSAGRSGLISDSANPFFQSSHYGHPAMDMSLYKKSFGRGSSFAHSAPAYEFNSHVHRVSDDHLGRALPASTVGERLINGINQVSKNISKVGVPTLTA